MHDRPHELFTGDGKRITSVCDDFVAGRELAPVERFTARSADGTEVDAWLVRPPDFDEGKRYPVLLTIHGGPFSQYGTGFFDEVQVYAGAGYCVLFSNPRGGSGYSEEWGRAIRGTGNGDGPGWGTVDYEDVMGVVDTALEKYPFLDADRLTDKIMRSASQGSDGIAHIDVAGDHHRDRLRARLLYMFEKVDTRAVGQVDVQKRGNGFLGLEHLLC